MKTITLSEALERDVFVHIEVGEYIAWWISHERNSRMVAVLRSYPTIEECEKQARWILTDPEINNGGVRRFGEKGEFVFAQVVPDR